MNQVRIQLLSPATGYLDVKAGTAFPLNFSLGDIRDISKRTGSYSKTITLVGNKNNNALLGNLFDVNVIDSSFDINRLQSCLVEQDGIVILDNMYLQLTAVKKVQQGSTHDIEIEYEAQLKDSSSDFFLKISNLELDSTYVDINGNVKPVLDFSVFDHIYNVANVTSSYNNTWTDGYKYIVPYLDPSLPLNNNYRLNQFKPGIYFKQYLDKIFDYAGYTYTFTEGTGNDIRYDKLIIPFNGDKVLLDPTIQNNYKVIANNSAPLTLVSGDPIIIDTEVQDINNQYDPFTGIFTSALAYTVPDGFEMKFIVEYDIILDNTNAFDILLYRGGGFPQIGNGLKIQPGIKVDPSVGLDNTLQLTPKSIPLTTVYTPGTHTIYSTTTPVTVSNSRTNLAIGTSFESFLTLVAQNQTAGAFPSIWVEDGNVTNNVTSNVDYSVNITSIRMIVTPTVSNIDAGQPVYLNSYIPKKIKQSDLIKSFCQMYNLFIETDPDNATNLIFRTRDKFYDDGIVVDWTKKLNKDREQDLQFLPELSSKRLILSYKDDSDEFNKGYKETIGETYGQIEYVFENEYVKNTERKELIFSPTPIAQCSWLGYVPMYDGYAPKTNIRILLDNDEQSLPAGYGYFIKEGITEIPVYTYPLIHHFNDAINPTFDINYGTCDYYYYNPNEVTNNTLYNLHWRRTLGQINNGKLLSAYFDLDAVDIQKLKLNDKIRIDNSYWNINKVIDYNANSNEPTQVELISIDDELELPEFQSTVIYTPIDIDSILVVPKDKFFTDKLGNNNFTDSTLTSIGNRNVGGKASSGLIVGNNNNVNGSVDTKSLIVGNDNDVQSNGLVIGNNNVVNPGLFDVCIIGDDITATNPKTLYTHNIELSPGSTINGTPVIDLGIWAFAGSTSIYTTPNGTNSMDTTSDNSIIAQGTTNTVAGSTTNNVGIIAGNTNTINGGAINSVIAGGQTNVINGSISRNFIGGGLSNTMNSPGYDNAIIGGILNNITAFTSIIAGGQSNAINTGSGFSAIISSVGSTISGFNRSVIIGGALISATASDTVYVPFFNIRDLFVGTAVTALAVDASGNVVDGSSLPIPTSSTWEDVLTNGNTSGPINPVLTDNVSIGGGEDPGVAVAVNILNLGDSLATNFTWYLGDRDNNTSALRFDGTHTSLDNAVGNIYLNASGEINNSSTTYNINIVGLNNIRLTDNTATPGTSDATDSTSIFIGTNGATINTGVINSVIIGGASNEVHTNNSIVLGGVSNIVDTSTDGRNAILAGNDNVVNAGGVNAQGKDCVIIGGESNINNGERSVIVGGTTNIINLANDTVIIGSNGVTATYQKTVYQQDSYRDAGNHTVTTTNNVTTTLYSFTPDTNGVWMIEANVTGFENATGDAIGAKAFHTFKNIGGTVTSVSTTTLDRKSNFPASVTVVIDTDGTNIRVRVTGRTGSDINWKCSLTLTK